MDVYCARLAAIAAPASNTAYADLVAGANPLYVREMIFHMTNTAAPQWALVRATAIGTRTSPAAGTAQDPNAPAATGTTATAWSVANTYATNYLRRCCCTTNRLKGQHWRWGPREFVLQSGDGIALLSLNAAGTVDLTFVWEE